MDATLSPARPDRSSARRLARRVALAGLVMLAACGGGGGGGAGDPTSPFVVARIVPANGASGVSTNAHVLITFSRPVAPATLAGGAIVVASAEQGAVAGTVALVGDGLGTTVEFAPTAPLPGAQAWNVAVASTLRSTTDDALGGPKAFLFRTGAGAGGGPVIPPASALRATVGTLAQGRRKHTATRLADGTVLVCGGFAQGTAVTDRAERFSPVDERFTTLAARMAAPRAGHTATVLADGRVLLAGGWYEISTGTSNVTSSAELYDPATDTFAATGAMTSARADHAALRLPDGRVLVTGGSELVGGFLADHDTAEVYDPATGRFTAWASRMSHTRATHAMVDVLDGRWLLVGGSDVDLRPETFDTATGVFSPFAAAAADRARFGAATARFSTGNVAVVGGERAGDVLYFDRVATLLRNTGSPTTQPRAYATATRIAPDRVLVAGGIDATVGTFVLATCDLIVEGGAAGSESFATTMWFPTGMADHTATVLADGRVLFCGGLNVAGGQAELDGAYLFTP